MLSGLRAAAVPWLCLLTAACGDIPSALSAGPEPGTEIGAPMLFAAGAGSSVAGTSAHVVQSGAVPGAQSGTTAGVSGATSGSFSVTAGSTGATAGSTGATAGASVTTPVAGAGMQVVTAGVSGEMGGTSAAGAGGAAGVGGSGSDGSAGAAGPQDSLCAGSELLFCESFEAATLDDDLWQPMQAAPSVDDTRAARGEHSLHVHTSATSASGIRTSAFLSATDGHYYGRMFVYFDALPTSPQWAHWTIVGANPVQSSDDRSEIRVGGQHDGSIERFGVGTDGGPTGDWTNLDEDPVDGERAVPLRRWLCIEWLHDWANDETRFYLDGEEHLSLRTTTEVKHGGNSGVPYEIPELGSVWVGFWNYNQGKPVTPDVFDVWIDEVAFDDERIGCEH